MPPPPHIKPENVLKRAQELIAVGQTQSALTVLHEHVTSKRTRNSPIASLEPVMLLFVELSVDLRKGKSAKDGLYQYKNIAQNTNVGTIELVLKKFIDLAEQKVTEAQSKADQVQSSLESTATTANVEDLDAIETPETILLATVSGEQSKDRTDRAIVTPWLKFLWETYRTVLEILKNNARLEIMYQSTALQAFQFCLKYTRKTEFRRLCELLRNHVTNAAKYSQQMHAINLNDPDTLQRHLDTRFQQLNVAVELELWQEAFRSVDDIHLLLIASKRPAKNVTMANYYEKLTRIFLVSDNFLFHAAAWSRYYNLLRQSAAAVAAGQASKKDNPVTSESEITKAASFVLLSALSIPVISTSRSRGALMDVDEARKNKNTKLSNLLSMPSSPTRAGLLKDALNKGLLSRARPEIRDLYTILEVDFHPLSIRQKISPILSQIGTDPQMEKYVIPLQQVILTRLFQQLSQVYESVELSFVYKLAQFPEPFQVSSSMIEKFIMNGCKKGDLSIRLDHVSHILTFDADVFSSAKALHPGSATGSAENESKSVQRLQNTPAEIARSQITRLAKTLHVTCTYVDPSYAASKAAAQEAAWARAQAGAEKEHEETLARRAIIEKKKEAASDALMKRQREEETRKRIRVQQAAETERQRLVDEHRERERRRLKDQQDQIKRKEIEKQLDELKASGKGLSLDDMNIDELDSSTIRAMKLAQLERDNREKDERVRVTAKRVDHIERAFRREEVKYMPDDYERQRQHDVEVYERDKAETLKDSQLKHKEGLALKNRLGRLVGPYDRFKGELNERRHEEFERRRKAAEREFENKKRQRIKEVREKKQRERVEREEAERLEREEEQRIAREAEEKAAKEEERKQASAERRAALEAERVERDESARKQREREEEAESRRIARKAEAGAGASSAAGPTSSARTAAPTRGPVPVMERTDSNERPPRLQLAGQSGSSWRDRLAAKGSADRTASPGGPAVAEETPLSKRPDAFVAPALREGGRSISRGTGDGRESRPEPPAVSPKPLASSGNAGEGAKSGKWVPPQRRERQ